MRYPGGSSAVFAGVALGAVLAVQACDAPPTEVLEVGAGIALEARLPAGANFHADGGMVRLRGPVSRNVSISPGETKDILVPAGTYSVHLEALVGSEVERYGERGNVVVREEEITTVTITLLDFVPTISGFTASASTGSPVDVSWTAISGAESYVVEASRDQSFSSVVESRTVSAPATSTSFVFQSGGDYFFRVRARNEFGSTGIPSEVDGAAAVNTQPAVTAYTAPLGNAVAQCNPDFQEFYIREMLEYSDPDGDVTLADTETEPGRIQSQYRWQSDTDWIDFRDGKPWTRVSGDATSGEFQSASCWRGNNPDDDFADHRVRIQDDQGVWSEWRETRIWLPETVEITEPASNDFSAGGEFQFAAVARDVNGDVVEGDPVSWLQYTPEVGTVDQTGLYTVMGSGLDRVYARAGSAWRSFGIIGPAGGTSGTWWAPCFSFPELTLDQDVFMTFPMVAYVNREISVTLGPPDDPSLTPSGDPDLYARYDAAPTLSEFDFSSTDFSFEEEILVTPSSDRTLHLGIHAFSDFSNVRFDVATTDGRCGFPGNGIDPFADFAALRAEAGARDAEPEAVAATAVRAVPGPVRAWLGGMAAPAARLIDTGAGHDPR